ncbi:conserved hypothetical protein [Cupriavidus taiwanensis]|uniref:DUF3883 domain-containing protein n=1 Tax=Cupriavidus taiwanensis TaxID=164546 RepID=UPI000E169C1F|nr:DUF3883 domain-containing protein [Cupriavidus taiwanensis]SOY54132.1 conserved hypothetical protein [Cupriavidus taiwanensis]
MLAFSPGLAQGCFELLGLITRQRLSFAQLVASFSHFGSLPSVKVVETAQALGWIRSDEEQLAALTVAGRRLTGIAGYEGQLRQALLDYIDSQHPSWIQNASFGRSRVLAFAGSQIAQVFVEAGLANGSTDDVVEFWDRLSARARGQRNERLTQIGRSGERLTLKYERSRTGVEPQWIAIENNADGYDILSVVDRSTSQKLTIEVKTSSMGIAGQFFLTRNEWDRANESAQHVFHLWDVSSLSGPKLAVVSIDLMTSHVPVDCGLGTWESVEVPYRSFGELFFQP